MVPLARADKASRKEESDPTDGRNKPLVNSSSFGWIFAGHRSKGVEAPWIHTVAMAQPPVTILVGDYVNID